MRIMLNRLAHTWIVENTRRECAECPLSAVTADVHPFPLSSGQRRQTLWASGWQPALQESEVADAPTLEPMMLNDAPRPAQAAIRTDLGAIFVSMELSRRAWLITSLSPGAGEKMSKHSVPA